MTPFALSRIAARHLLLAGTGLLRDPGHPGSPEATRALVDLLGFVQVDSISTVQRAHHLILFARHHGHRPEDLKVLLEGERQLWEHWTHDAAILPASLFPHWRHRFDRHRLGARRTAWWKATLGEDPEGTIEAVRERIAREGPLLSKDFDAPPGPERGAGWWSWKPAKGALEHLWRAGELAITARDGFQKVYDLTERVLPAVHGSPKPAWEDHVAWACRSALSRLGVATGKEIAGFWATIDTAEARRWCDEALTRRELIPVEVEGQVRGPSFALVEQEGTLRSAVLAGETAPAEGSPIRPLAPFDPIIRDRDRALRLFGFDYRFEAFVPQPKRQYGYYVLPLLQGEALVGRIDTRVDRAAGELIVQGLWWEPGIRASATRKRALRSGLERLAAFVGANRVTGGH